jgi:acetolactate synthase small subunit
LRKEGSAMNINIQDSLQQLKEAVEELEALRTVIAMAEDHPVYSCDRETLIVAGTALDSILRDIKEVTDVMSEELKNNQLG